jgi:hypothetical protein
MYFICLAICITLFSFLLLFCGNVYFLFFNHNCRDHDTPSSVYAPVCTVPMYSCNENYSSFSTHLPSHKIHRHLCQDVRVSGSTVCMCALMIYMCVYCTFRFNGMINRYLFVWVCVFLPNVRGSLPNFMKVFFSKSFLFIGSPSCWLER